MQNYKKSTFWRRFLATIIDSILVGLIVSPISSVFKSNTNESIHELSGLFSSILGVIYAVVMIVHDGKTIGKRLMKLKVVSSSYGPVTLGSALIRESIGKFLSGLVLSLGYLTVLLDPQRRAWHDKWAKTYVVVVDQHGAMIPTESVETVTSADKITFWILLIFGAFPFVFLVFLLTYLFVVQPHQIKGSGMEPNYYNNAYYLTSKLSYRLSDPQRGDVVVYEPPHNPDVEYFKRIVGLPGDEVTFAEGFVSVNGQRLQESYLAESVTVLFLGSVFTEHEPVQIPDGMYLVLGDNRGHSSDSRDHGLISRQSIVGKMTVCYWQCMGTRR